MGSNLETEGRFEVYSTTVCQSDFELHGQKRKETEHLVNTTENRKIYYEKTLQIPAPLAFVHF